MAVQKVDGLHTDCGKSGADLTGKEFYFCKRNTSNEIVLCGNEESVDGVISEGKAEDLHTSFNTLGNPLLKVVAGSAITIDQEVCSDANGKAKAGSTNAVGKARNTAAAGEMVTIRTFTS